MHTLEAQSTDITLEFELADTSDMPGDYLFLRGSIDDIVESISESSEVEREAILRAAVERLLDGSEAVEDVMSQKIREMFELSKARTKKTQFLHGNSIIDMSSFVAHDRSGKDIGEQYTAETEFSPNLRYPVTTYSVALYDGRKSRMVIHDVESGDRSATEQGHATTMNIYDTRGGKEVEVFAAAGQREVYKALLYELLLSAEMQARRRKTDLGEQVRLDEHARRLLTERDAMFAPATSLE